MPSSTFVLDTHDRVPVVVHRWLPDTEVRGIVNLAHGLSEHAARYAPLATALNELGVAVYAEDHRGHGRTAPSGAQLGVVEEGAWRSVVDDLHRVTRHARAAHPGVRLVLLGHSMGSFLAQQYAFTFPDDLDGLVLSGSNAVDRSRASAGAALAHLEMRRVGPNRPSYPIHSVTLGGYNRRFEPVRTRADWLTRDLEQVERYLADPWCGMVPSARLFAELFSGLLTIADPRRVREVRSSLPVYLFSGADDPVGGTAGVDRLLARYARAGLTDVQHRLYPGGRHEMLNEINRDEVVADLVRWLRPVLGLREAA